MEVEILGGVSGIIFLASQILRIVFVRPRLRRMQAAEAARFSRISIIELMH